MFTANLKHIVVALHFLQNLISSQFNQLFPYLIKKLSDDALYGPPWSLELRHKLFYHSWTTIPHRWNAQPIVLLSDSTRYFALTMSFSQLAFAIFLLLVFRFAESQVSHRTTNGDVIVQLFQWDWKDVKKLCENVTLNYGIGAVQVRSPNSLKHSP